MPKTQKMNTLNLEKIIMEKVSSNEIKMKPEWYFVLGSTLMVIGLISFAIVAIFALSLLLFLIKEHGPMGEWRLQIILDSFPLWIPLLASAGIGLGVYLLKQYDFSYKKNFVIITLVFVASIILAAIVLHYTELSTVWFRQGPMRRFYMQNKMEGSSFKRGQGNGIRQKQIMYSPQ